MKGKSYEIHKFERKNCFQLCNSYSTVVEKCMLHKRLLAFVKVLPFYYISVVLKDKEKG